ncbi:coiled-coil domain-containing protein 66-like [Sinocyclocheilus grahami]|uniref:coiled-coil domain-containing protein 66-like n=1 Tax=Sinocyclocheilus grahami TaxID=75366 RepID=UPI0007ACAC73|nr:PREDICTED: coiled-coil domain-containing protein 66-like [Sinocyclocheilus grahami]
MMNLGDGLLFELDNGKPRLVLAKYGAESKSFNKKGSCRIPPRKPTHKIINPKQGPPQPDRAEQEKRMFVSGCRQVQHPPQSTERQQAILKGLCELRQGLLQRQRELETSLNPALQTTQELLLSFQTCVIQSCFQKQDQTWSSTLYCKM